MTMQDADGQRPDSQRRRLQYSLRTLFVVTTGLAIACSIFFALPVWFAFLAVGCLVVSTPMVLTVILIYGRGDARTFCIGALFPGGVCLLPGAVIITEIVLQGFRGFAYSAEERRVAYVIFTGMYCTFLVGNGLLAVYVRRLLGPRRSGAPRGADPAVDVPTGGETDYDSSNVTGHER